MGAAWRSMWKRDQANRSKLPVPSQLPPDRGRARLVSATNPPRVAHPGDLTEIGGM